MKKATTNNIRVARKAKGWTMKELGIEVGAGESTISQYETGKRQPDNEMLLRIAEALDTTVGFILGETQKAASSVDDEAVRIGRRYSELPESGKGAVRALLDYFEEAKPRQAKLIPLLGTSFAAGSPEPDFGNALEDYEVDAGSRAEFAIRVHGDSMEPKLMDGSIALGIKREPKEGDVVALMLDGGFLVKQYFADNYGNVYLRSLNEKYEDIVLRRGEEHVLLYFGTII